METTKENTIPKGEHKKVSRPKQDGYEIVLNLQDDTDKKIEVKQIWGRFGTFESNGNYKWDTTMAIGPVEIKKGEMNVVATVDDDQLPTRADSCYYQLLCEIGNEHGEPEILMTEPTLLQNTN
jgi:hypothetical protein